MSEATWINLDETAIPYHVKGRNGMKVKHVLPEQRHQFVERATLNERRSQCTLVATVTQDEGLQQHLPQVLMPNITGQKKKWKNAQALISASNIIHVNKDTNGWSCVDSMITYFKLLKAELQKHGKEKVVIVMDAHPSHSAWKVINLLTKWKWKILMIPSRLTWMLQPLDAYMFAEFKHMLTLGISSKRTLSPNGRVDFPEWLEEVICTIERFLGKAQARVFFEKCGCSRYSKEISEKVKKCINPDLTKNVRRLTEEEFHEFIGKRFKHIHALIFKQNLSPTSALTPVHVHPLTRRLSRKSSVEL